MCIYHHPKFGLVDFWGPTLGLRLPLCISFIHPKFPRRGFLGSQLCGRLQERPADASCSALQSLGGRLTVPPASLPRSIDSHEGMGTKVAQVWHQGGTCLATKMAKVWAMGCDKCELQCGTVLGTNVATNMVKVWAARWHKSSNY